MRPSIWGCAPKLLTSRIPRLRSAHYSQIWGRTTRNLASGTIAFPSTLLRQAVLALPVTKRLYLLSSDTSPFVSRLRALGKKKSDPVFGWFPDIPVHPANFNCLNQAKNLAFRYRIPDAIPRKPVFFELLVGHDQTPILVSTVMDVLQHQAGDETVSICRQRFPGFTLQQWKCERSEWVFDFPEALHSPTMLRGASSFGIDLSSHRRLHQIDRHRRAVLDTSDTLQRLGLKSSGPP